MLKVKPYQTSVMMPNANETITINLVHATKDIKPTPTEDTTVTYTFYDETDKKQLRVMMLLSLVSLVLIKR
ncbi:hypothetical protein [Lactobacillus johnsonii]|uniref:hypothetical protein n=1 Tax=Lactobacillus johnsonii TaxID=33959 RepID=UPI0012F89A13|nr:hypothetical protein [Lactobacillus johnsonii]